MASSQQEHALSLSWFSKIQPRIDVRVDRAHVLYEGWLWKESRHLHMWRKRWAVLTNSKELLTFEDEMQHGGAMDRFSVVRLLPPGTDGRILLEVACPSKT